MSVTPHGIHPRANTWCGHEAQAGQSTLPVIPRTDTRRIPAPLEIPPAPSQNHYSVTTSAGDLIGSRAKADVVNGFVAALEQQVQGILMVVTTGCDDQQRRQITEAIATKAHAAVERVTKQ